MPLCKKGLMDSFEKRDYLRSGNKSTWGESNKGLDVELELYLASPSILSAGAE